MGASGAVSAVIFGAILFVPTAQLAVFFIPMPAFIFAGLYLAFTYYEMQRGNGYVNHSAHWWGAVFIWCGRDDCDVSRSCTKFLLNKFLIGDRSIKSMLKILLQPYPFGEKTNARLLIQSIGEGTFIALFLIFFQPFGVLQWHDPKQKLVFGLLWANHGFVRSYATIWYFQDIS